MGFSEKELGDGEHLHVLFRPHVKRLIGPVLVLLLTAPAATFLAAVVPDVPVQGWVRAAVAVAALLVLLRWTVWPILVWRTTVYAVTDRRLVTRSGVLNRSGHDMPLSRLNDVSFSHTVIQRMLGCGTLVVESAGERGQLLLDDVPRVEHVQRVLYELSERAHQGPFADHGADRAGERGVDLTREGYEDGDGDRR